MVVVQPDCQKLYHVQKGDYSGLQHSRGGVFCDFGLAGRADNGHNGTCATRPQHWQVQAVAGAVLGCGLAALICYGMRQGPFLPPQLKLLSMEPWLQAACIALAAGLSATAAIVPGWRSSRLSVVLATRGVD